MCVCVCVCVRACVRVCAWVREKQKSEEIKESVNITRDVEGGMHVCGLVMGWIYIY